MNNSLLSPQLDIIFNLLFNNLNSILSTKKLINSVLESNIEIIDGLTGIDPIMMIKNNSFQEKVVEALIVTETDKKILTEFRFVYHPIMRDHMVFFPFRMNDSYSAEHFDSIVFSSCNLIQESQCYHDCYRLISPETRQEFPYLYGIHNLDLNKLPSEPDGTLLWTWMKFIGARNQEDLDLALQLNPDIQQSHNKLIELSADKEIRKLALRREKQLEKLCSKMFPAS
jgi:hypothetical protein